MESIDEGQFLSPEIMRRTNNEKNNKIHELLKDHIQQSKMRTGCVEFIHCREDIQFLLEAGYPIRFIHEIMTDKQKITMSYSNFCKYVSGRVVAVPGLRVSRPRKKKKRTFAVS